MRIALTIILLFVFLVPINTTAQSKSERESLRGLKGVEVIVENIRSDAERYGLAQQQVKTDVELKLRKAGIKVLTEEESIQQGITYLYVNVNVSEARDIPSLFSYGIEVSFKQKVALYRDPSIKTIATTWQVSSKGVVGANKLRNLREIVADYVDEFINDYLSANSR